MRDWLVRQYLILGFIPFQNWMLLVLAITVPSVLISWWMQK